MPGVPLIGGPGTREVGLAGHRSLGAALVVIGALVGFTSCEPTDSRVEPIQGLAPGEWSWVPVDGMVCDDGSPTGIAVSEGPGPDLVVFLNGGGACWDYLTCYVLNLATRGPFGENQFAALGAAALPGSILDRTLPGNPYADATLVFVPYCTGDVHGGDRVATYTGSGGTTRTWHHAGHRNVELAIERLHATWPAPRRLVVSGSSAGGFGALLNYDDFRRSWPEAEGVLVDDSGPPLDGRYYSPDLTAAWRASWGIDDLVRPICGTACETSLAPMLTTVAGLWPEDRLALLSSLQDLVISGYYQIPTDEFETALLDLTGNVIGPLGNARTFLVPGTSHTMLGEPAAFTQGQSLLSWLGAQASGDEPWVSRQP